MNQQVTTDKRPVDDMKGIWIHKRTGKSYRFIRIIPFKNKETGLWDKGVMYSPVIKNGHSDAYVRETEDFLNKFIKTDINDETTR